MHVNKYKLRLHYIYTSQDDKITSDVNKYEYKLRLHYNTKTSG